MSKPEPRPEPGLSEFETLMGLFPECGGAVAPCESSPVGEQTAEEGTNLVHTHGNSSARPPASLELIEAFLNGTPDNDPNFVSEDEMNEVLAQVGGHL